MSFGSKSTSSVNNKQTAQSTPVEQVEWKGLRDKLISMAMQNLGSSTDMSGYTNSGIQNINNAYDASAMARNNALAARGLSSSPIAGNADILSQNDRAGNIAQFQNTIPLLQRDMAQQDWTKALNLFNPRPMGTSSNATVKGVTSTETKTPILGSLLSGITGGLGEMIGGGYLTGLFSGGAKAQGGPTLNPYTGEWE